MGRVTVRRPVLTLSADGSRRRQDVLAGEEPLELRVGGTALAVIMRTPGHDVELAHGFLLAEGVLGAPADVTTARYCDGVDDQGRNTYNVLDVALAPGVEPPVAGVSPRGLCGTSALDAVRPKTRFSPAGDECRVSPETLLTFPGLLRERQRGFGSTGGLHAAGLFTAAGTPLVVREDVGRHNAADKVTGWALLDGRVPLGGTVLVVSGRVSAELVRKAAMAGVPVLAAVSAPSSLAAELADEQGITLVGFLRGSSMNVYTHASRITGS
jgi:FdhD protein